jgi:hypothetical protein
MNKIYEDFHKEVNRNHLKLSGNLEKDINDFKEIINNLNNLFSLINPSFCISEETVNKTIEYIKHCYELENKSKEKKLTKTTDELIRETFSNAHRKPLEDIESNRDDYDEIMRKAYYEKHRGDSFT